ncbi:MAG: hypothetical protein JWP74_509 [Marmoricola sp.]|nr:hypothetical protein [Marmoricola sp.]
MTIEQQIHRTSVLAALRAVTPEHALTSAEARRVAERQANLFRRLTASDAPALQASVVVELPRIRVTQRSIPTSGLSYWNGDHWLIVLNENEPVARQRFTLMHEYKHIVDHSKYDQLYQDGHQQSGWDQGEAAADYFAGCVLVPKVQLQRAWYSGVQSPAKLAHLFGASVRAVEVRLAQVGLTDPTTRCSHPRQPTETQANRFYRPAHPLFTQGAAA